MLYVVIKFFIILWTPACVLLTMILSSDVNHDRGIFAATHARIQTRVCISSLKIFPQKIVESSFHSRADCLYQLGSWVVGRPCLGPSYLHFCLVAWYTDYLRSVEKGNLHHINMFCIQLSTSCNRQTVRTIDCFATGAKHWNRLQTPAWNLERLYAP